MRLGKRNARPSAATTFLVPSAGGFRHVVDVGYEDEDQWDEAHEELAASMAQLEEAVQPYLEDAQDAADRYARQSESSPGAD